MDCPTYCFQEDTQTPTPVRYNDTERSTAPVTPNNACFRFASLGANAATATPLTPENRCRLGVQLHHTSTLEGTATLPISDIHKCEAEGEETSRG